jgi:hypothetical protein
LKRVALTLGSKFQIFVEKAFPRSRVNSGRARHYTVEVEDDGLESTWRYREQS